VKWHHTAQQILQQHDNIPAIKKLLKAPIPLVDEINYLRWFGYTNEY